jgi:ketosteroid isomerase-like protein
MSARHLAGMALLALTAACRPQPAVDVAAEERAIRDISARQNEWFVARDTVAIGALYAPDAVLLPPNRPRVAGADSIRHGFAVSAEGSTGLRLTAGSVVVAASGDLAIEDGTWTWQGPGPQGEVRDEGKYLVVWVKRGGEWKMLRDIFNGDRPAPIPVVLAPPAER